MSYAYTRWSRGTALKMLGRLDEAASDMGEAERLFHVTRDIRGMVYTRLGRAEVLALGGIPRRPERLAQAVSPRAWRASTSAA